MKNVLATSSILAFRSQRSAGPLLMGKSRARISYKSSATAHCVLWLLLLVIGGPVVASAQQTRISVSVIESLIRSKQYDEALAATKSDLRQTPNDFRMWTLEGIVLALMGSDQEAVASFDKALRIAPTFAPALKGEVQILYRTGDKRAVPLLERILKADTRDLTAHEMLAMLQRRAGNCSAATEQFLLSANAIDHHPESLEGYGYCLVEMNKNEEAIPVFEKLAALLPDREYPRYDLAIVLVATKQNDAALKELEPLITPTQQDADVLSLASMVNEALGKTPEAVALLRQAIVSSPTTVDNYVTFAAICLDHDSFQVGIEMISAGLQRVHDNPNLYISRGLLYAQLAQYDKAEADFNQAERLDSRQSISSYALDLAEVQKNNPDLALSKVRSQLKSHPDSPLLNFLLAKLLMNQTPDPQSTAYKEAMRATLSAVKAKPDMVDARDLLASMYMQAGQYDRAVEESKKALEYSPADESATYHLVISLRHLDRKDELPPLVKRLAELHRESLQKETARKRYRLVKAEPPLAR